MSDDLRPVILDDALGRAEACCLFCRVLVHQAGYHPGDNDPAGRHIVPSPLGPLYCDSYDAVSMYFGLRDAAGILVAAHRASWAIEGTYHVERFLALMGAELPAWLKTAVTIELSRLVVDEHWRGSAALVRLLSFEIEHLARLGIKYVVTAAAFPRPGRTWVRMGMKPLGLPSFKMNPNDEHELTVLYADLGWAQSSSLMETVTRLRARRAA